MIHVHLKSPDGELEFQHSTGPLEFGRGPQRELPRQTVLDAYVSTDQLVVEELENNQLRVDNLSEHVPVQIKGAESLGLRASCTVHLPVQLRFGKTDLRISAIPATETHQPTRVLASVPVPEAGDWQSEILDDSTRTLDASAFGSPDLRTLRDLGAAPDPERLARWFETLICVQQAAASSSEFYIETAQAVVNLVGLDQGFVLLREGQNWMVAARHTAEPDAGAFAASSPMPEFSHRVLNEVLETGRTYYQTMGSAPGTRSLKNVQAVVAAPILDSARQVVGVVYGSRTGGVNFGTFDSDVREAGISALEAQIIQVLAAAVGAGLERVRHQTIAMRSQLQFENFFSAKLAQELARDTNLLEGREREVTIVFSDVRDFSLISRHLGPGDTFRMMQDVMELQTSVIHEHDGVVVDYVGDGLFAMWNAPTDQMDHAKLACQAVLAIIRKLPALNDKWSGLLNRPLQLGVGVNTGTALVGNTGSRAKFKYGPMGPAVNLASRVEDATKQLGVNILLTDSTYRQLDESFACRHLCRAALSGMGEPIELFELSSEEISPEWQRRREAFETALQHFTAKRWAEACMSIYPLISSVGGEYDIASLQLLSRAVECLKSNPEPFDPVVRVEPK